MAVTGSPAASISSDHGMRPLLPSFEVEAASATKRRLSERALMVAQEEVEVLGEKRLLNTPLEDPNNHMAEKYGITPLGGFALLIEVPTIAHVLVAGFDDSDNSASGEPVLCQRTASGSRSRLAMSLRVTGASP
jgi:hypothetical protein